VVQGTLVLTVRGAAQEALRERLRAGGFEFRGVEHALFSARGAGVTATLYRSGKLVIQGDEPEAFARVYLDGVAPAQPPARSPGAPDAVEETTVGSDESGKGDYFGPLVVAAVRATPEEARQLARGEVRDSKLVADETTLRLGGALRASLPHAIAALDPPAYNARHAAAPNLNPILAELHARAIRELASPGMAVVVDQFARGGLMARVLDGCGLRLTERTRAEELPVVAAASLVAREHFLRALARLSDEFGVDLAKGAGEPADRAARRFVALLGREALGRVAKLHFKNTHKLGGRR
jgi:ribonuclease HIII